MQNKMQMTVEFAKKQGYKKLSRTKHWYKLPRVVGNVLTKIGTRFPRSVCFESLRHGGGSYIVYTFRVSTPKPPIKVLGIKDTFESAQRIAESYARQND